jgi:hypothetical protein
VLHQEQHVLCDLTGNALPAHRPLELEYFAIPPVAKILHDES